MAHKILITGGSGYIGSGLAVLLKSSGYQVSILSRTPETVKGYPAFKWDVKKKYIDIQALEDTYCIVHLAGVNLVKQRWTEALKQEITDSRVQSTDLLRTYLAQRPVPHFICASATGYYGDGGDRWQKETDAPGNDFLAHVCTLWEQSVNEIARLGIRTAILRTGVVLSKEGGALPQMALPVQLGLSSYLGNGRQYMPWIHLDDLCGIYKYLLENIRLEGPFNGVAPHPVTNKAFTRTLAQTLNRPFIPVPVPQLLLKAALGERSQLIFNSNRVSADKIIRAGYTFQYVQLKDALTDIYS